MVQTPVQASICFSCHDGSGSIYDMKTPFASTPPNNEATDAYYSHPVTAASSGLHVLALDNEFQGVLDRHAVCADCHNPHLATAARPVQTATGWSVTGNSAGAPGVGVTNGPAGSAPSYALKASATITYGYELCFQCHSSWTVLPSRAASSPSRWALDAAAEFNPANNSYHPVEAAGRNQTAELATSLAGSSPFKAWNFSLDSTIRCEHCHGDPSTVNQTPTSTPLKPAADALEPTHASPNRGLLIAPYRDRDLKQAGEAYNSTDFALCYLCHAEKPFVDPNQAPGTNDTLFWPHAGHMSEIVGRSNTNLSIDSAGAGGGLALCAECHFRPHSTAIAFRVGDTAPTARSSAYPSLVNFSPNVQGVSTAPPTWTQPDSAGIGSCTLRCHGFTHSASNATYTASPGAGFTATPTTGSASGAGLLVQFTDASRYVSAGNATWAWDFGDGSTSTVQSPSHVYASSGTYTVTLTVTRATDGYTSTLVRSNYISATP